jgi:hypothetical protein
MYLHSDDSNRILTTSGRLRKFSAFQHSLHTIDVFYQSSQQRRRYFRKFPNERQKLRPATTLERSQLTFAVNSLTFVSYTLIQAMMKWITIEPAVASIRKRNPKEISMDRVSDENSCRRGESKGAGSQGRDLPMNVVLPFFDLKSFGSQSVASSAMASYPSNSGVYFDNIEVTGLGPSVHPLQMCAQPAGKAGYSTSTPKGRPLSTPSLVTFKVPKVCLEKEVAPPPAEQARKRKFLSSTHETHLIPDESPSIESKIEKREAERVVPELHSRDYRLSADEILFVEAATKLACNPVKGRSDEGSKNRHSSAVRRTLNALPPPPFTLSILH